MIDWLFGSDEEKQKVEIAEDVSGDWTYHLRHKSETKALCGTRTMPSKVTRWALQALLIWQFLIFRSASKKQRIKIFQFNKK